MSYVFLAFETLHTKDNKEFYILSVLDIENLVVQKIFVSQDRADVFKNCSRFEDISDLIRLKYNSKSNSYQLVLF